MDALERLIRASARHARHDAQWISDRDAGILAARAEGATWEQIAAAAGMSRAGVINAANVAAARSKGHEPR